MLHVSFWWVTNHSNSATATGPVSWSPGHLGPAIGGSCPIDVPCISHIKRFEYGPYMRNIWEKDGNIWKISGKYMGNIWKISGKYMGNICSMFKIYGKYMFKIVKIYEKYMFHIENLWEIYEKYMGNIWEIYVQNI